MAAMEDWDLWIRLTRHGPVRIEREPRIVVRKRPASASRDLRAMAECGLAIARRAVSAGAVIEEADRRALFGRLQHDLAYACLLTGDRPAARRAAQNAIALQPSRLKNYLYWMASVIGFKP